MENNNFHGKLRQNKKIMSALRFKEPGLFHETQQPKNTSIGQESFWKVRKSKPRKLREYLVDVC